MKRILPLVVAFLTIASAAFAADMPVKAPSAVAPMFNWSGFYVGVQGGYAWGKSEMAAPAVTGRPKYDIDGGFGGATAGMNWQGNSNWVLGIETDFSGSDIHGTGHAVPGFSCFAVIDACDTKIDWFGTVRARLGYAAGNVLVYGTGGWAYGHLKADISHCLGGAAGDCGSATSNGWTAGAGIEWALNGGWSAKIEYLHVDLGRKVYSTLSGCGGAGGCSVDGNFDAVRIGLNYKFGGDPWGKSPVVAKY